MKSPLSRLRRRLIRKLGGYTDPGPMLRADPMMALPITKTICPMEKFWAEERMIGADPRVEECCKYRVLQRLVETLDQSGFICWEKAYDDYHQVAMLRATLMAVDTTKGNLWFAE